MAAASTKSKSRQSSGATTSGPVTLLIGTRKGGFILKSDATRRSWTTRGPIFLGNIIYHMVLDHRDRKTMLMAASTGHLGPTVFRSTDSGKSWKEATLPPRFPKVEEGQKGKSVHHVFWLTAGHASEPGTWYAGTSPQALFRTRDGGDTWESVVGFNEHTMNALWCGPQEEGAPDGATMHSIIVDPRDARHLYLGMSSGGVFESMDAGETWTTLNRGMAADFIPLPEPEYGHDPHCVRMSPVDPDVLYQQNHCGIYRIQRPGTKWDRIGDNMPKKVGDIGFPMTLHPRDVKTAWVFPMDGTSVWPRVSPDGKPAVFVTRNEGKSWKRQADGFPKAQGWFTVFRQAMTADRHDPVGLYAGTTSGEIWASRNEGEKWSCIASHLPRVLSVEVA